MPLQVGLYGILAAGALLDDEEDEERYRRIQAEREAKNLGAVIGLATGAAIVVNDTIKKSTARGTAANNGRIIKMYLYEGDQLKNITVINRK